MRLTENSSLPFAPEEVIRNFSTYTLSEQEADLLKHGLKFAIQPCRVNKTEVFSSFELMHRAMKSNLKDEADTGRLKAEMSFLANSYVSDYKPSKASLKKHGILKRLRSNDNIIVTHPDKGEGVIILNKGDYVKMINDLIEDKSKFKLLNKDPTITRQTKLQKYLCSLKKKQIFNDVEYKQLYPVGSKVARIYGTPKTHKLKGEKDVSIILKKLKLRPIISSIGAYNYHLAKYLKDKLSPHIPNKYCIKDTFSFVTELSELKYTHESLISYDVQSLFTNILLAESIDLKVNLTKENSSNCKMTETELNKIFFFATAETHFLFLTLSLW